MSKEKTGNLWWRWEDEVKKFMKASKNPPPDTTLRHWHRSLMFIFMQELSKNVLNDAESIDSIKDRIIDALQVACGFKRVRMYSVIDRGKNSNVLKLEKASGEHGQVKIGMEFKTEYGKDNSVDTFIKKEPLIVDEAAKLNLVYKDQLDLKIGGPYIAIPLFIGERPHGLICADAVSPCVSSEDTRKIIYIEYKEHFETFARSVMAAIENRSIFEQREQQIKQFKMVKEFNELIESVTDKERLLNSFIEHCVEKVHADGGHLKLYNKDTGKMDRVASFGEYATPIDFEQKPNDISFSFLAVKNKTAILINDLANHGIMRKNIEYCKKRKFDEYRKKLRNRRSALIVPLIKHTGEIKGVLDLHSKNKNQFTEIDKGNLMALASSVTYALDKTQQLEQRDEFLTMKDLLLRMLKEAFGKADCYECVLSIIREHCRRLLRGKKPETICLTFKDLNTGELVKPSFGCVQPGKKDCYLCFKEKAIVKRTLATGEYQSSKNELAFPIYQEEEVIGVLYIEGKDRINLTENEREILSFITGTAAILANTARNYEEKIKQSTAFYEAGQLSTKTGDFREWFNPVMDKVLDISGRENRSFHLVLVEEKNGGKKLFIRGTSPLFIEGKEVSVKSNLLGLGLPMNGSLSGEVVRTKKSHIIFNIDGNKKLKNNDSKKVPYYEYDERIKSEIGIPLKIKGRDIEKVIGVFIIDSIIPNDFRDFDLRFYETFVNYLATIIHNQKLYEERAKFQEELYRTDRATELSVVLNSFFHDIKNPLSEINAAINLLKMNSKEISLEEYIQKALDLSHQLLSVYDEFVYNFTKTVSKREKKGIQRLIFNSLNTIERTIGIGIPLHGNYIESDLEIFCYPVYIEMAFRSIIHNAIKFSKGLEPESRYLEININPDKEGRWVKVVFESTTVELIPEDKLKLIFKPFERFSKLKSGSGLGLSLADLCIKLHGGFIKAENVKDKRAVRFEIVLPKGREYKLGDLLK